MVAMIDPETASDPNRRRAFPPGSRAPVGARSCRRESGQVLVEFALILPVFILLVVGVIDFGFAFNTWNSAQNAAREGARFAAVSNSAPSIKTRAIAADGGIGLAPGSVTLSCNRPYPNGPGTPGNPNPVNTTFYDCSQLLSATGCTNGPCATAGNWQEQEGDIVQVNVRHDYQFKTPLPRLIGLGGALTLKASIQTRYEG
jgi:uncharacterized protein (UPF0333 family)